MERLNIQNILKLIKDNFLFANNISMLKLKTSNGTVTVNNGKLDYCVFCQDQTKLVLFMNWKPAPLINHTLTGGRKTSET